MAEEQIDILEERLSLYRLQKQRVELDTKIEKALNKTFPSLNQDLRLLREMLDDVQKAQGNSNDHGYFPEL